MGGMVRRQRGFTIVELMITVAIIAVLAVVVVPQFTRESRKVKSEPEVSAMFAEIATRQEQYKIENGQYLTLAACPSSTTPAGSPATECTDNTDWIALRLNPPQSTLRCIYEAVAGTKDDDESNPGGFTWTAPDASWWYVIATCDGDGQSATNATFFTASSDTKLQKRNEGN